MACSRVCESIAKAPPKVGGPERHAALRGVLEVATQTFRVAERMIFKPRENHTVLNTTQAWTPRHDVAFLGMHDAMCLGLGEH